MAEIAPAAVVFGGAAVFGRPVIGQLDLGDARLPRRGEEDQREAPGLDIEPVDLEGGTAQFDMHLIVADRYGDDGAPQGIAFGLRPAALPPELQQTLQRDPAPPRVVPVGERRLQPASIGLGEGPEQ